LRGQQLDDGRRALLGRLLLAGATSLGACATSGSGSGSARGSALAGDFEVVEGPIVLRTGDALVERTLVVSENFSGSDANAVVVVAGDGVRIRNVRLIGPAGWDPRWDDLRPARKRVPGMFGRTSGIGIRSVRDVAIEDVAIEGFPRSGILGYGITGGLFRDVRVRHCFSGVNLTPTRPSEGLLLERVHTDSTWSGAGLSKDESAERPGGWIGGDGLALNSLRNSSLVDCTAVGEMFAGFKLTNPQQVRIEGLRGPSLMIQGTAGTPDREWSIHGEPARDVRIERCVFDKGLGRGRSLTRHNCLQLSQNIERVEIVDCLLNAAGQDGHAIQASRNAHAYVVGCTIRGFNGVRGQNPAHAIDLAWGSSVNDDFERVNRFIDQQRIRLDRNP
jgi:hypothetical protein